MNETLKGLNSLLNIHDKVVVAVSGGPDSIYLLEALLCVREKLDIQIIVAHVNHKLRLQSEEEALFVESLCKSKNLIYEYMEIKEYDNDNLESVAREKRYTFFKKIVNKYNAKYLMTAHHGDDLVETILMRLVRGSSLKGYSGFKKIVNMGDYYIIRPLINITKEDILKYLDSNNIKYYIDKSNYSMEYTRNRYRHKILPFLKEECEDVNKKFLKFSEELDSANNFINNYISNIMLKIKNKDGINIEELNKLDSFLIKKIIEYELSLIYINDLFLISDKHTSAIFNMLNSNKSNMYIDLPNGYRAIKEYNYFRIGYNKESKAYKKVLDKDIYLDVGVIKFLKSSEATNNYVIRLNSKDIKLPLIVRSRVDGDKIYVKNLSGSKKIKDIYIDEKIPKYKRNYPIVTDSDNNILWVCGIKKSKFDVEKDGIYDIILAYEEEE